MKYNQAVKLAIDCLERRAYEFAFDANLYKAGLRTIATKRAHKKYTDIKTAIEVLRQGRLT